MPRSPAERSVDLARLACACLALAAGAVLAWRYRHASVAPDGIQYIDLARLFVTEGTSALRNGYWSPFYPAALGLAIKALAPSPYWLYPVARLVNFVFYAAAVAALDGFLVRLMRRRRDTAVPGAARLEDVHLVVIGYALFSVYVLYLVGVTDVSPDIGVAALVLGVSALLLRVPGSRMGAWAGLGIFCAAGYYMKAIFFPAALVYLACSAVSCRRRNRTLTGPVIATTVFLLFSAPLLWSLSTAARHVTFSEVGRLNYAWYVNGWWGDFHWLGQPAGSGTPLHPVTQMSRNPDSYAFPAEAGITYPPWFDATYWYSGMQPRIRATDQIRAFRATSMEFASAAATGHGATLLVLFAVLLAANPRRPCHVAPAVTLPALAWIAAYLIVHVEGRFIGAQLLVLASSALASWHLNPKLPGRNLAAAITAAFVAVAALTLGPLVAGAARNTMRDVLYGEDRSVSESWRAARSLGQMGVQPGERVASIGAGPSVEWAQLAQLQIVAEIPATEGPRFWALTPAHEGPILAALCSAGARIAIGRLPQDRPLASEWRAVPDTSWGMRRLPECVVTQPLAAIKTH